MVLWLSSWVPCEVGVELVAGWWLCSRGEESGCGSCERVVVVLWPEDL